MMRFAGALAILSSVAAEDTWWGAVQDQVKKAATDHDVVGVKELLENSPLTAESCGAESDLLQVKSVHFDMQTKAAVVRGSLLQPVLGGKVVAEIEMTDHPENAGLLQRAKGNLMWAVSGKKEIQEDLCQHLDHFSGKVYDSCPVPAGEDQELRFAFNRLPEMVMAGTYNLKFSSVDPVGNQITCVTGSLKIAPGKDGQMFRKLEEDEGMAVASAAPHGAGASVTIMLSLLAGFVTAKL